MPANRARRTRVVLESATRHQAERRPIVCIKVGGSLLTDPRLIERLEWLMSRRSEARTFSLCGGGMTADLVRDWQKLHGISDFEAHRLALAAMSFNEQLVQAALPKSCFVRDLEQMEQAWFDEERPILRTMEFVDEMEARGEAPLPPTWDTSSDTIAAWCGSLVGADELILAKSTDLPEGTTLESAREAGLVDRAFGVHRRPHAVTWVNLRAEQPTLIEWL